MKLFMSSSSMTTRTTTSSSKRGSSRSGNRDVHFVRTFLGLTVVSILLMMNPTRVQAASDVIVNCENSDFDRYYVKFLAFITFPRMCRSVRFNSNQCEKWDYRANNVIGYRCAKECPRVSGCNDSDGDLTTPVPTFSAPVVAPSPSAPVGAPVASNPIAIVPIPVPTFSSPVFAQPLPAPVGAPVTTSTPIIALVPISKSPIQDPFVTPNPTNSFGSFPAGPYITVKTSSQVVSIPRPYAPAVSADDLVGCPHNDTNLSSWHDIATWGNNGIPTPGANVVIPEQTRVLLSQSIAHELGIITIPSTSELIIGSSLSGISLDIIGMHVLGKLTVGSPTCRFSTPVTITLHGQRPANAVTAPPESTYKGILVTGGTLSLHGKRYFHTWTRLAKTVQPGDKALMLQEKVNWEVGQQIVIVTSTIKDSRDFNQNEIRTVASVQYNPSVGVGAIVYLNEAVSFQHIANQYYQVEVGLLSRTIKIQGAANDSEPSDPDPVNGSCMDPLSNVSWTIYHKTTQPCMGKSLTGFGGHIRIESGGIGQVEGVELYRMGQTNVKGRYPIHFHLLGICPGCYFKDSSVHRSFYRCISIHGTHNSTTTENVAFDVIGYCYYLEDGIEQNNTISYNMVAHVHTLGPDLPRGGAQNTALYVESEVLTLPADVTASGYYITNVNNYIIGNAASGGWTGFAFPTLLQPLESFRTSGYMPARAPGLTIDGNTAHSTGWWWYHAGAFYLGGELYYDKNNTLTYNPGRTSGNRDPCKVHLCIAPNTCTYCDDKDRAWLRLTNSKAFLTAGVGLNSWSGRLEILGYESHDARLSIEALSNGFWLDNALMVCRTGETLSMPSNNANRLGSDGFVWYDTGQEHIITRTTLRNCGVRSDAYNQYDTSPTRGCDSSNTSMGCNLDSSAVGFLTHSDQFNPEIMQATKAIVFENCGRRFRFSNQVDSVSGRSQNWFDADGSISGLNEPTLIGSGLASVKDWWHVDNAVQYDPQAPLRFIKKSGGPQRSLAHIHLDWNKALHDQVGSKLCGNGSRVPCPWEGFMRHIGAMFNPKTNPSVKTNGLPITASGDVVGPVGGYGWVLDFNTTAPREITFSQAEIDPGSVLLISIPYPIGTKFVLTANGPRWCYPSSFSTCSETFSQVSTFDEVRSGKGNTYYVDPQGVLTFRLAQTADRLTGDPLWFIPDYNKTTRGSNGIFSLFRFERNGVRLPMNHYGTNYLLKARCPSDSDTSPKDGYCPEPVQTNYDRNVCPSSEYEQVGYDKCCQIANAAKCVFADGSSSF